MSQLALSVSLGFAGAALGAVVGFLGPLNLSILLSPLLESDAVAVGWVFCLFTVPAGVLLGGLLGAVAFRVRNRNGSDPGFDTYDVAIARLSNGTATALSRTGRAAERVSALAIASLVASSAAMLILLFGGVVADEMSVIRSNRQLAIALLAIPPAGQLLGLILGYGARRAIRLSAGTLTGRQLGMAGIALGWLGLSPLVISFGLLLVMTAIAIWIA
jgi:hypothetical protein